MTTEQSSQKSVTTLDIKDRQRGTEIDPNTIPNCEHGEWTLGCQRCFAEMRTVAASSIAAAESEVINAANGGAVLFAWYTVSLISDMDVQLTNVSDRTLDLVARQMALSVSANLRNLSRTLIRIVQDARLLDNALAHAATFAGQMHSLAAERQKEKEVDGGAGTIEPSTIVLTDK